MLTARTRRLLSESRVVVGLSRKSERSVVLCLEVKLFNRIIGHQVIKVGGRVRLYLLQERRYVRFVFQRKLLKTLGDVLRVEVESELDVINVVL